MPSKKPAHIQPGKTIARGRKVTPAATSASHRATSPALDSADQKGKGKKRKQPSKDQLEIEAGSKLLCDWRDGIFRTWFFLPSFFSRCSERFLTKILARFWKPDNFQMGHLSIMSTILTVCVCDLHYNARPGHFAFAVNRRMDEWVSGGRLKKNCDQEVTLYQT